MGALVHAAFGRSKRNVALVEFIRGEWALALVVFKRSEKASAIVDTMGNL